MSMSGMQGGMAAGGAIGEALGAIIGEAIAAGDMERARNLAWSISRKYADLPLPTILKMYPELQGDTAFANVRADERYTSVEDQALAQMMQRASGGMTAADEANLVRARMEAQNQASAAQGAAQRLGARTGFRAPAAAQAAMANQQAANRLYAGGVQAAGDASNRALQALQMGAGYASNLAGRDLAQKNQVAGARDRITEFNLGRKDKTQLYNNEIGQRQYENALGKLGGETAGLKMLIDQLDAKGQSARRTSRAVGGLAGSAVGLAAGA